MQTIYARYAHIQDDGERSVAVVRDLQRRGIIDTLVQALAAILTELLGTDGAPARHYKRQLTVLGMQTGSIIDDVTCLILKLVGINDSNCAGQPSKRDISSASNSFTGLQSRDPAAMKESLGELLSQVGRALEKESFQGETSLFARAAEGSGEGAELLARQFPATLGVEGLLSVLRELLDAVLNTLLPLSPRDAAASPTSSAAMPTGTNCPPPGTPNDGMYRPGCPGYGRRELSTRDSEQLESMAPMLEMLIQKLEPLVEEKQKADTAGSTDPSSAAADPAAAPTSAAAGASEDAPSTSAGSSSSAVEGALAQLSSSASTPDPTAAAGDAGSSSGAAPTARDFLEADGFHYVKRQVTADAASATDAPAASASDSTSTPSSGDETASYSMVKSMVSELFNLFGGGGAEDSSSASKADSSDSSSASGSSSSFMSLVSNVLGGLSSREVAEGPLKRNAVHGLLDRAVGTSPSQRIFKSLVSRYVDQAVERANEVIQARADFEPVWTEVKKLGNSRFGERSTEMAQRSADDGSFNNVWSNFREMIDASIAEDKKHAAAGSKRSPAPKVDVKPFADAATRWAQKHLVHEGAKAKRDLQQFKPLANAAGEFAKTQMKEWTAALNKHNGSQKN